MKHPRRNLSARCTSLKTSLRVIYRRTWVLAFPSLEDRRDRPKLRGCLRATSSSLVSTAWVDPSQRRLFSTVVLDCVTTTAAMVPQDQTRPSRGFKSRPGPLVIMDPVPGFRHVRHRASPPHLVSGPSGAVRGTSAVLERLTLTVDHHLCLDVLVPPPIFSSFAGTLKLLRIRKEKETLPTRLGKPIYNSHYRSFTKPSRISICRVMVVPWPPRLGDDSTRTT